MGVRNLEISEAKARSRGTWQRANFRGIRNVIFEWKGAWFAFNSGRKISIPHLQKEHFRSWDPGETSCLNLVSCYHRGVGGPTKISTRDRGIPLGLGTLIKEIKSFGLLGILTSNACLRTRLEDYENPGRFQGRHSCHKYMKTETSKEGRRFALARVWNFIDQRIHSILKIH